MTRPDQRRFGGGRGTAIWKMRTDTSRLAASNTAGWTPPAKAGAADNQTRQLPPPLLPPAEADAKKAVTVSASVDEDDDDGSDE